jgi:hypothetical protein
MPAAASAAELLKRRPVRLTATVSWSVHQALQERSIYEGRSVSNLIAHLLESGLR